MMVKWPVIKWGAKYKFCYNLLKFFICCSEGALKQEQNERCLSHSISTYQHHIWGKGVFLLGLFQAHAHKKLLIRLISLYTDN